MKQLFVLPLTAENTILFNHKGHAYMVSYLCQVPMCLQPVFKNKLLVESALVCVPTYFIILVCAAVSSTHVPLG